MAKYSIDSSTLTALGDAIRIHAPEKDGKNIVGNVGVLKSSNATGPDTYTTANFEYYNRNQFQASKKAYDDVAKIKVKLNYKTYASKPGYQSYEYQMRVYDVAYTVPYVLDTEDIIPTLILDLADDEIKSVEFEIDSNEITLALVPYKSPITIGGSYSFPMYFYAEIEYFDKDNNHLDYYEMIKVKNTMTPLKMVEIINDFTTVPENQLHLTGSCKYRFAFNNYNWIIDQTGNKITSTNITDAEYMFSSSTLLENIPFEINLDRKVSCASMFASARALTQSPQINGVLGNINNMFSNCNMIKEICNLYCDNSTYYTAGDVFYNCSYLEKAPNIYNLYPSDIGGMFAYCHRMRELPEDFGESWNWNRLHTYAYGYADSVFYSCYSLRKIPTYFLNNLWNIYTSPYSNCYYTTFYQCYTLDDIIGMGVSTANLSSNVMTQFLLFTYRLKDFTFQTNEDGTPQIAKWKNQVLDLSSAGYTTSSSAILNYNSGITADKEVKDDTTYQALKNDPDWFSTNIDYSRYNHISAVNTINSLPDCSATGTNTIKFKGMAGALTDEGAINTLTEEEIAVATAKGWTVSFV